MNGAAIGGTVTIKRALVSVFDKTGIEEFCAGLNDAGVEIISSGGTARAVEAAGIPVRQVREWTGFPEMLGHRVVTLHPKVHGGILALRDDPEHQADMEQHEIEPVDLVCVSLYPFRDAIAREGCTMADAVEMIDIGGPSMVRSAAKNHRYVTVVTDRSQYARVIEELSGSGGISSATRREFALAAFSLTARYDAQIAAYLAGCFEDAFPRRLTLSYTRAGDLLRYGENPHQQAAFYVNADAEREPCIGRAKMLGGKPLSYNNYFDANGALELVKEFDRPAVAIIKHANPAGVAVDEDLVEAYRKAYFGDVDACMGGIIAVNRPVTTALAEAIAETYGRWGKDAGAGGFFAEIVLAPSFEDGAVEVIGAREGWGANVRLLEIGPFDTGASPEKAVKHVVGGLLVQDRDRVGINAGEWRCVTKRTPDETLEADMRFAWLVCKHVKSNAIVLARQLALLGAGAGQMSRVNSARLSMQIARNYGGAGGDYDTAGCVMASDAFLPFPDSLDRAAEAGAAGVIQPGGAKRDGEVIARADELGLAMILTGTRHFNH